MSNLDENKLLEVVKDIENIGNETTEETELELQAKELFGDLVVIEDSPEVYEESEEYSHEE